MRYSNLDQFASGASSQEVDDTLKFAVTGLGYMRKNLPEDNLHYAEALQATARAYLRQDKLVEANHYFSNPPTSSDP